MLMYLCRVSFLTSLDIYKAYFRGRHIREYKESTWKRWSSALVTYWDPCRKGGVHILKSSKILKRWKVSAVSSSTRNVESRDKGFVLDLQLLFTIVDCFSRRFPPRFFTVKLVCFIGFPRSSYLVLFIFPLHDFDMILMFVCFNKFIHNKSN